MEGRGKKSGASLEVVQQLGITAVSRPEPPSELTAEQSAEWQKVVDSMPADWFKPESHGILTQYCRHVVSARRVAEMIDGLSDQGSDDWLGDYDKLLKMQEREGRALSSLATRMRITQQTEYSHKKKRNQSAVKKPWE